MDTENIKETLQKSLKTKIEELTNPMPRRIFLTVKKEDLLESFKIITDELKFTHISTITGRDRGEDFEILYHLANETTVLTVKTYTGKEKPSVPTITRCIPGAILYEREVHDLLGIEIEGHPDLRPLVLPEGWPEEVYPLRKDWKYNREEGVIK
ncbi:MAG: NADH-quinone oxidoreductase subunit C [Candidatus Edwardsbacteria bacterium]